MKKFLSLTIFTLLFVQSYAQNEGRVGIFTGVNQTMLFNADDAAFGDYLPTFKSSIGIEASYLFTLGKSFPLGFSVEFANTKAGQNYKGAYIDSTSYYAYSRLNYLRSGVALHFGTNPRRQVALEIKAGANIGFLTKYQERYELIRYNNDRFIMDIKNNDVSKYDTSEIKGTITSPLYNKTDNAVFGSLGLNFLIARNWVFGFYGRMDYGMSSIENTNKLSINYNTDPTSTESYTLFNTKVKYHDLGASDDKVVHSATNNLSYGIFLTLKYRIYNKEKIEFYYRENGDLNH